MKKVLIWMLVIIMAAAAMGAQARIGVDRPRIILLTVYQQMGWGDRIDVGCVDEKGGVWTMTGSASSLGWPADVEGQLAYLRSAAQIKKTGEFSFEELFDLNGLIASVEAQDVKASPAANDAGTEVSYAIRYGDSAEAVCLGMSGDDVFENTDPDAQALYALLRELFPDVKCYGGTMGPAGFQPIPVADFLGLDRERIQNARIREYAVDCEVGLIESEAADERARDIVLNGRVVGKANATVQTGGTTAFVFYDAEDNALGGFEMYRGLLATSDGMYRIE